MNHVAVAALQGSSGLGRAPGLHAHEGWLQPWNGSYQGRFFLYTPLFVPLLQPLHHSSQNPKFHVGGGRNVGDSNIEGDGIKLSSVVQGITLYSVVFPTRKVAP